ncbi:cytochrome d ubiquinol oxidase subunit II [Silanimonas sp.]|uniref:cytochrome d ubiquinol oxidase subunit II n=1 Tax=Silanimonas sp. TaxID=1929290 RepID=UPI001BBB402A|nr:cytochrome d ubiquinol oxidase subunit II [Silanimonas sp.]MBS3895671.1 cytochrome d ubiquinol oxidase subunit II [Silanimonas sp.]MBS3958086.1 cytochrome d ubiquinol oxidase subunit II [Xanthomonadaceae bacterium]
MGLDASIVAAASVAASSAAAWPGAPDLATPAGWLPIAFLVVMGLSMLAYVVLDGYDLGVGILMRGVPEDEKDIMVASIGPFWDANETWLVLGVGILLVAFPIAHGVILGALYLPIALMLFGLILRGVAFEFRVKAKAQHKQTWNRAFFAGSLIAALVQGYMLGLMVMGFERSPGAVAFAALIAVCLVAGYCLLGAGWLIIKGEGALQQRAVRWARNSLWLTALGIAAISLATPLLSERIFDRWFSLPWLVLLAPIPIATAVLFFIVDRSLRRLPKRLAEGNEYGAWVPFGGTVGILLLAFYGLAYSLFPYLVVDEISIWQAAASPESLMIIFVGACVVIPVIVIYTVFVYRVFSGKAQRLDYT